MLHYRLVLQCDTLQLDGPLCRVIPHFLRQHGGHSCPKAGVCILLRMQNHIGGYVLCSSEWAVSWTGCRGSTTILERAAAQWRPRCTSSACRRSPTRPCSPPGCRPQASPPLRRSNQDLGLLLREAALLPAQKRLLSPLHHHDVYSTRSASPANCGGSSGVSHGLGTMLAATLACRA